MKQNQKRKLVFIITGLRTGGAELMLHKLLSEINREHFDCTVISLTGDGPVGKKIRELSIPVKILGMMPSLPSPMKLLRLASWIRQLKPDLVQTWMYHADLIGGIATRLAGNIPVIWGIRNNTLDPASTKTTTFLTVRFCAFLSGIIPAHIISNTYSARQVHIRYGYNKKKLVVISNGFDLSVFKPDSEARDSVRKELGISSQLPIIGLISRFDAMKDHRNFIEAAGRLCDMGIEAHYLLCGNDITWQNQELRKWIEDIDLKDHFHLLGRREDMPRITASLDISTMCSYGDAFPNAIGEAMSCGIPCVVTDVGDLKFIVGDTGTVVPPRNSQALASGWEKIIKLSSDEKEKLGLAARQRVQENFSLPVIITRYENIYEKTITEHVKRE